MTVNRGQPACDICLLHPRDHPRKESLQLNYPSKSSVYLTKAFFVICPTKTVVFLIVQERKLVQSWSGELALECGGQSPVEGKKTGGRVDAPWLLPCCPLGE